MHIYIYRKKDAYICRNGERDMHTYICVERESEGKKTMIHISIKLEREMHICVFVRVEREESQNTKMHIYRRI